MLNQQIELKFHTPLSIASDSLRTCWDSFDKSVHYEYPTDNINETDIKFLDKILNQYKHETGAEHLVYHFSIKGISRALLQELARHRILSLCVKSTRYTLKELIKDENISLEKYCVLTGDKDVDYVSELSLGHLSNILKSGITNDVAKYCLPESYRTSLRLTINGRSLKNMFNLRLNKNALKEFQILMKNIYLSLPDEHKFLYNVDLKMIGE